MRRALMLVAMLLFVGLSVKSGGQSSPPISDIQERRATVRPILDLALASGSFRPKVTMQDALKIAENFIDKQHIDISSYWLYRGIFYLSGDENTAEKDKIPGWHLWWVNNDGAMGDYVEIFVDMNGRACRVPSM